MTEAGGREAPTVVVGLGNPILGDDGVGWHVAGAVDARLREAGIPDGGPNGVEVISLGAGGLTLMEHLVGRERAILVDAMTSGRATPGSVLRLRLEDLPGPDSDHTGSPHDASLRVAIEAGRALGARLPRDIDIIAIEVAPDAFEFGESLTPAIAAAVPAAAGLVLGALSPMEE